MEKFHSLGYLHDALQLKLSEHPISSTKCVLKGVFVFVHKRRRKNLLVRTLLTKPRVHTAWYAVYHHINTSSGRKFPHKYPRVQKSIPCNTAIFKFAANIIRFCQVLHVLCSHTILYKNFHPLEYLRNALQYIWLFKHPILSKNYVSQAKRFGEQKV